MVKKIIPFLECFGGFNETTCWSSIICASLLEKMPSLVSSAKNYPGWDKLGKTLFPPGSWKHLRTLIIAKSCQENTTSEETVGEWNVHLAISENWTWRKEHKRDNTDDFECKHKKCKHTLCVIMIAWICRVFLSSQDFKVLFIYVIHLSYLCFLLKQQRQI